MLGVRAQTQPSYLGVFVLSLNIKHFKVMLSQFLHLFIAKNNGLARRGLYIEEVASAYERNV